MFPGILFVVLALVHNGRATEPSAAPTPTLAGQLLQSYSAVQSFSCEIRKHTTTGGNTVRMLSRVHFLRPDRIHVQNLTPVERRIVCDGQTLHYYQQGAPFGFRCPVSELDDHWLTSLRKVPGTATDHLLKLQNVAETVLPGHEQFPVRRAYATDKVYVVLSCDAQERLARIEFFAVEDHERRTAQYDYSQFLHVADSCWIPRLHQAEVFLTDGASVTETTRIDVMGVNETMAESLFSPSAFFPDVQFVREFEKTLSE